MLYVVRGKNRNHERILRVHANSAEEAEKIGYKRGLFVTEVTAVEKYTELGALEKLSELVWKVWRQTPPKAFRAFGQKLSNGQVAALLVLGAATWVLNLHALKLI